MSGSHRFLMRMRGLLRKEALQIRRDPSSIALAMVLPIVLLFLFGYGVSLDAENVPIAVVADDRGEAARELAARFEGSRYFQVTHLNTMGEAIRWLEHGEVDGIVQVQSDFTSRLRGRGLARIQLIVDGIDANRARLIQGYTRGVLQKWIEVNTVQGEAVAAPAVSVTQRIWFNASAQSRNFLIPGLVTLIMTLTGILLTALVVAREWERGTMEALMVTPLRRIDFLMGKIVPYFVLGMLGMGLTVTAAVTLFKVPLNGSLAVLILMSALFMLASLGLGLLISSAIRVQFVAAQLSIVTGFLPALFLSGLLFDLESTPLPIQMVSRVVPARYFVDISHTLFMAGDIWPVLLPDALALAAMAALFFALAFRKTTKRLE
ncbi:ABC transporter permease [Desulfatitalea tepidiphila]|uniref:ABC transporter permease n=1 Tax=Desulfatitalea tepidiphila TaxID=1185843 RepID=UPI0006B6049E|nr:ABC transporter permease [Desulfatitalea tepidiphila]